MIPSTDSTSCSAEDLDETISSSSLLESYSDQLQLNCSLLEQNLLLRSQFHGLKDNLAICESHNSRLGAANHQSAVANANLALEISRLQAEIAQLQLQATPTVEQQRAKLVYAAAVQRFRLLADSSSSSIGYALPHPSAYWQAIAFS